jgi:PAS domain S-box-containing protein
MVPAILSALAGTVILTLVYMQFVCFQRMRVEIAVKEEHIRLVTEEVVNKDTKYKVLFENSNDAVFLVQVDLDNRLGRILDVNGEACSRLGYSREELLTMDPGSVLGYSNGVDEESFQRLLAGSTIISEGIQVTRERRMIPVQNTAHQFNLEDMDVLLISSRDITRQKKAEEAQKESEERLRRISEGAFEGIGITENGRVIDANSRMAEILGYELSEIVGRQIIDFVTPASRDLVTLMQEEEYRGVYEHEAVRKDGSIISVEVRGNETLYKGRSVRITTIRDVTDRKRVEEKLRGALEEKEVLLKEIRHRVKTNLQSVLGLLDFQSSGITDGETRRAFRESQNRILTMALIHEKLYEMDNLSRIDFEEFTGSLINHLAKTYAACERGISIQYSAAGVRLNVDTSVPCGLIINELVTNALEHAFDGRIGGEVRVDLSQGEDGNVALTISDGGTGLSEEAVSPERGKLGLLLVHSLVDQLSGSMEISRQDGTAFRIEFNEYHEAGAELH